MRQTDIFNAVRNAFADSDTVTTQDLYKQVAKVTGKDNEVLDEKQPVGKAQTRHNLFARQVRWQQQTLKQMGVIEKVEGKKSLWQITGKGRKELRKVNDGICLLAFSTKLGIAILGDTFATLKGLNEPIHLMVSSPPYPLREKRAYGNVNEHEYVDFICAALDPIVKNLVDGGSIALNISNDIFMSKTPARSLYRERLVLALHERFGLYKMDELIWQNPNKPPGPIAWASKTRFQLNVQYEPIYWFCNNPIKARSNNQRVLEPHSEQHKKYMANGGVKTSSSHSDGAYRKVVGAYSNVTKGKIPKNILKHKHNCPSQSLYKRQAKALGLKPHGAPMPLTLARFLIEFMSKKQDLVVDPFAGSFTIPLAAERLGRRWVGIDNVFDYVRGSAERFVDADGYWINKELQI